MVSSLLSLLCSPQLLFLLAIISPRCRFTKAVKIQRSANLDCPTSPPNSYLCTANNPNNTRMFIDTRAQQDSLLYYLTAEPERFLSLLNCPFINILLFLEMVRLKMLSFLLI